MSTLQARPATALLARKGLAAPIGAASDTAQARASDETLAPASETLPEVGALAQANKAPAASLLPLDFLAGRPSGWLGAAEPEAKLAPSGDTGRELSVKPEVPSPDPPPRPDLHGSTDMRPAARAARRRFPARAAGLVLALAAAGYGYQNGWFGTQPPEPPETPVTGAPAESPPAAPAVTESDPSTGVGQSSAATQPSVDVVRIEPDGTAVIAGRAAPGTELILLDNGAPIGTVAADAYGEWVLIPDHPLPSGAHDFGLVIKEVRGGVSVPAAGQTPAKQDAARDVAQDAAQDVTAPGVPEINEPGTVAGADAAVPIPPRKPDIETARAAGMPSPAFVVQLASLKSRAGAQQEWRTLRKRFPEILSTLTLSLDEAKLAGGASVVRLRIGGFPKQAEAAALCARLAAKDQDCLVVRTSVKR